MGNIFLEGFALQAGLIFALGAQNLFILESGLQKRHHLTVSFVCFLCDLCMILLGVAGASTLFAIFPAMKLVIGAIGVAFLFFYGVQKIFEKMSSTPAGEQDIAPLGLKRSIILAITFSVLNPHAYLDAWVLIGGYSSKYADMNQRLMLGLGAAIYSGVWFLILSYGSGFMKPLLTNHKRMKLVGFCMGAMLVYLSGKLAMDVWGWIPVGSTHLAAN